jgi:hypothetical protein
MRPLVLIGAVIVVLAAECSLWADLPGPPGRPRPHREDRWPIPQIADLPPPNLSHIRIEVNADAQHPQLVIPKPMLERIHPAQPGTTPQGTVGRVDLHLEYLLPAIALAFGGLCLFRGRTGLAFAAAILLTVSVMLSVGRSRLEASPPSTTQLHLGAVTLDDVQIVVNPEPCEVKLTLPPAVAARFRN